jgi:hypothetical protein
MTTSINPEELQPCPFCGATAKAYIAFPGTEYPWHVDVEHGEICPMRITDSHCYKTDGDLAEAWNTRADTLESLAAENARLREALEFYAEPGSWFGVYMVGRGPMAEDWSDDCADDDFPDGKPGLLARKALSGGSL